MCSETPSYIAGDIIVNSPSANRSPFAWVPTAYLAEGIPFETITAMSVQKLYSLKGEIVARGIKALTGLDMPVFTKRRFQHGAVPVERMRHRFSGRESDYRRQFLSIYAS